MENDPTTYFPKWSNVKAGGVGIAESFDLCSPCQIPVDIEKVKFTDERDV